MRSVKKFLRRLTFEDALDFMVTPCFAALYVIACSVAYFFYG